MRLRTAGVGRKNVKKKRFPTALAVLLLSAVILAAYIVYSRSETDVTAPEIRIEEGALTLSVGDGEDVLLTGVTARDNVDGDVTDSLIVESVYGISEDGSVTVRYAAFDSAGNVAKAERTVVYGDYESPVITLDGPLVFEYGSAFDVFDYVGASDVFDGDITRRVKATMLSEGVTVSEEGTHEVQFRVTNSVGDSVQLVMPVEVYPDDAYNATLTLSDWLVYIPVGAEFDPSVYPTVFKTVYGETSLTEGTVEGLELVVEGDVDVNTPGVYAVSYKALRDINGRGYVGYTKLIVVVEGGVNNG